MYAASDAVFIKSLTTGVGMRMSRLIIGTVLLGSLLLLSLGPAAFAESGMHDTDDTERLKDTLRLKNFTIPWNFPLAHPDNDGGTCKAFQQPLVLSILSTTAAIA